MPGLIVILLNVAQAILGLITVVLIVFVVLSWLFAFDIVSRRNQMVSSIYEFCARVTDPLLRPIRRIIPPIAGVDLSVLVLLLGIELLRSSVLPWLVYDILLGQPRAY